LGRESRRGWGNGRHDFQDAPLRSEQKATRGG